MLVSVLTLFPRMVTAPLAESILGKAQDKGLLRVHVSDIRDFAPGKHRVTDDAPYGGGAGMVMRPEPWGAALELLLGPGPTTTDTGQQTLAHYPTNSIDKPVPNLWLLFLGKHTKDTVDSLAGIDGMQG